RIVRADHRRVRLEEGERFLGHLVAELGGVLGVVASDADDLRARDHRREQADVCDRDALPGGLQAAVDRVALDGDQLVAVLVQDAVLRVLSRDESCEAHARQPMTRPPAPPATVATPTLGLVTATTAAARPRVLEAGTWRARERAHRARAEALTAARRARRARGERDPVEDFLFEYYPIRPGKLARWHPGVGIALRGSRAAPDAAAVEKELASRARWRWHTTTDDGVILDDAEYLADRSDGVRWLHEVLSRTARRPAHLGCLGLHEWA